jgi:ABC-type Fe3+-hydroxamate transport system substrate-binding protein
MFPTRIVSLVPSQTELLYDLGLDNEVVGITKFCVHPNVWFVTKQRIGGTKNVNLDLIDSLVPDLILANYEENTQAQIEYLQSKYPTYISNVKTFANALKMIEEIGEIVGQNQAAKAIVSDVQKLVVKIQPIQTRLKTLYLIWRNPYMLAGNDTYIHDMMRLIGLDNVCLQSRYPVITIDGMKTLKPQLILLSSEPYPFKQKHIIELQLAFPNTKIMLVDGEMFSWYGSRMKHSFTYFSALMKLII